MVTETSNTAVPDAPNEAGVLPPAEPVAPVPAAPPPPAESITPVATNQRIEALDVVRGFALLGIFMMNIEFFNRTFSSFNEGILATTTGIDWAASHFVNYFVAGKFWTIFSLLFGMGFAVMMIRAERTGREFKKVYLRRVLALGVFGAAHYIFGWEGDILFSYAIGALALMFVLYGKTKPMLIGIAVTVALGFLPDMDNFFGVAAGLGVTLLIMLYLRGEKRVKIRSLSFPIVSFILLLIGTLLSTAAVVFWLLPDGPVEPRLPLSVFGPILFITGWLSWKYYEPVEKRSLRMAVSLYMIFAVSMTAGGVIQRFAPDPDAGVKAAAPATSEPKKIAEAQVPAAATTATPADAAAKSETPATPAAPAAKKADDKKADDAKPKKTKEERAAERKAEREKRRAENRAEKAKELAIFTKGTYWDTVDWRARRFLDKASGDFGFSMILIGMFMLGGWFVRSGVMDNTADNLPLFRKMMLYGLPVGIGLGLLGSLIATGHTPGDQRDGWGIARGLIAMGSLPACLGYVGMVVLMLHSNTVLSKVSVLAYAGRMALTNYLTQTVICVTLFYGFALGNWGLPRAQQLLLVLVVYAAQIAFSRWWLSKFRYGPMEWVWRGFTYRQLPALRV